MFCAHCSNTRLEPRELATGLVAAVCPTCEGSLLSLMNYRFWVDRFATDTEQKADASSTDVAESESVNCCPKCNRLMTKYQIGLGSEHKLDLCAACDEAWLDRGEWQLLASLDLQGKLPKIFTDAWQRNIRKQRQEQALNERYEKLLGAGIFNQAKEFKQWLYKQPQRDAIKQYLMISPE